MLKGYAKHAHPIVVVRKRLLYINTVLLGRCLPDLEIVT